MGTSSDVLPDVLILRDPRESAAKCSLTPLRGRDGFRFVSYHHERRVQAGSRILLDPEGELLTPEDSGLGLLLIDCSWRRVRKLRRTIEGKLVPRRLPPFLTGYPRQSKTFPDPEEGLASVEALFIAMGILGWETGTLLHDYRWREPFLERNPTLTLQS